MSAASSDRQLDQAPARAASARARRLELVLARVADARASAPSGCAPSGARARPARRRDRHPCRGRPLPRRSRQPRATRPMAGSRRLRDDRATLAAIEADLARDTSSRLSRLCTRSGSGPADRDLLHACLRGRSTRRCCACTRTCRTSPRTAMSPMRWPPGSSATAAASGIDRDSPLLRWAMLASPRRRPASHSPDRLDPRRVRLAAGSDALDADLAGSPAGSVAAGASRSWPVDDTVAALDRWLDATRRQPLRVHVAGAPGVVAGRSPPLVADRFGAAAGRRRTRHGTSPHGRTSTAPPSGRPSWTARPRAVAFSRRSGRTSAPPEASHFPLQFVVAERRAVAAGRGARSTTPWCCRRRRIDTRRALWQRHAPWSAGGPGAGAGSARHASIARFARTSPVSRMRGPEFACRDGCAPRSAARESLGDLAQRLECPFGRDDLVVTAHVSDALDDLLFEAHDRVAFWEQPDARRLFPQGRGLLALFSGPPGTGKTMSAQVVAATLGMDLFRIDLAAVVSKWVGETQPQPRPAAATCGRPRRRAAVRRGRRPVRQAHRRQRGQRPVRQHRHRAILLQAIESYRGVALLSTNRKGDIDPAFVRRLRYVFDFPVPDRGGAAAALARAGRAARRRRGAERLSPDLQRLAAGVEVTGAQIKLAVLTALFASRRDQSDGHRRSPDARPRT